MSPAIHFGQHSPPPPPSTYYFACFEDYLKPKNLWKKNALLVNNHGQHRSQLRLKLLEHPVLAGGYKSKRFLFKENVKKSLKSFIDKHNKRKQIQKVLPTYSIGAIQLPPFLTFLHARNDHSVCKRKSGFEIYCEIASIHGFKNFVNATTWQRILWFFIVLTAVIMSGSILLLLHLKSANIPTILYSETTQYPTSSIPFPAVTICNVNKISKSNAERLARKFQKTTHITLKELTNSFNLALATTENIKANWDDYKKLNDILELNNYTMFKILEDIAPNCDNELLKCTYRGRFIRCGHIFKKTLTPFGPCCSFNYKALSRTAIKRNDHVKYISNCGHVNGLTVLLDPELEDYKASSFLTPGFQIFIHDANDYVDIGTTWSIITPSTTNRIRVWPQQTYATHHINSLKISARKCYLPNERKLYYFASYSLANCLAECRSLMFFEKCHCSLPYRPKMHDWTACGLNDIPCFINYKYLLRSHSKRNEEQLKCNCYPSCDFQQYKIAADSKELTRKYSMTEKRLYRGINITNQILLRVYISELHAERLRLDVYENWLSFIGTFGGITGLFMGCSFLSGFELIFFVFVRPACNWWNKKQIQNRIKKRQKKAQQELQNK